MMFTQKLLKYLDIELQRISDRGYFIEVDVEYPKKLFNLYKDLPLLPKREKTNKCKNPAFSIEDKKIFWFI